MGNAKSKQKKAKNLCRRTSHSLKCRKPTIQGTKGSYKHIFCLILITPTAADSDSKSSILFIFHQLKKSKISIFHHVQISSNPLADEKSSKMKSSPQKDFKEVQTPRYIDPYFFDKPNSQRHPPQPNPLLEGSFSTQHKPLESSLLRYLPSL